MSSYFIFVYLRANYGGAQTFILRKAKWLKEHGYNILVLCDSGPMVEQYEAVGAEVLILDLPRPVRYLKTHEVKKHFSWIYKNLSSKEIYCVECYDSSSIIIGEWISSKTRCRFVLGLLSTNIFNDYFHKKIQFWLNNKSIYSINSPCTKALEEIMGDIHPNIVNLPVPVNIPSRITKHEENYRSSEFPVILTVSRHDKGKEYVKGLIESCLLVRDEYPNFTLNIVGDGPLHNIFKKIATTIGLSQNIHFIGTLTPLELEEYFTSCDVYVGMGTTILQASCHSKPAIVVYANNWDCISPGFFCDLQDDSFGEKIEGCEGKKISYYLRYILDNPITQEDIGERCYQKVISKFGIDSIMNKWLDFVASAGKILPHSFYIQRSEGGIKYQIKKLYYQNSLIRLILIPFLKLRGFYHD